MATTDKRGKRVGGADSRVSESAKAEMPAYGFDGMTVGEILDLKRERERNKRSEEASNGKGRLDTTHNKH